MSQVQDRKPATNRRNMSHARQGSRDLASETPNPTTLGRRNLPRASHACEWCRTKKVRCDQQQPCVNCIKHSIHCEYGTQRRSGRKELHRIQSKARERSLGGDEQSSPIVTTQPGQDAPPRTQAPERIQAPDPLGAHLLTCR